MFPIALPNCSNRCGNVKIPYPYGTSEGCYLNDTAIFGYYFINCTTTDAYGQSQPKIGRLHLGVHKGRKWNGMEMNNQKRMERKGMECI